MVPPHCPATSTLPLIDQRAAQFSFWPGNAHLSSEASAAHKLRRNGVERRAVDVGGGTGGGSSSLVETGSVTGSICGE